MFGDRHGTFNRDTIPRSPRQFLLAYSASPTARSLAGGGTSRFEGFDLITPNEREARFALGDQDSVVRPLALELHKRSKCKTLILKLGDRGIITYRSDSTVDYRAFFTIETFADRVVDAVGAGDALLAYATLAMVATKNESSSILGSLAAGIECEHEGNWPVTPDQVTRKLDAVEKQVRYE